MRVRLAEPKSKIQEPLFELFGQPRACGKATDEKCELLTINQEQCSRIPEYTDRVGGKALPEVIPDRVHSRLNRGFEERRNLFAIMRECVGANPLIERMWAHPVNVNLPALIPQVGSLSLGEPNLTY